MHNMAAKNYIFWLLFVMFIAQITLHGCASNQPQTPQVKQLPPQQSETKPRERSSQDSKSADSSQQKSEESAIDTEKSQQSTANTAPTDTEKSQQSTAKTPPTDAEKSQQSTDKTAPSDTEKSQQSTAKTAPSSPNRASEAPNISRGTIEETATRQRDKSGSGQKPSHAKDAPVQAPDQQSLSRPGQPSASQEPTGTRTPPQTGSTQPRYAPTSEELKLRLDRRLDNSLSTFDGKLLKERAIIESSRSTRSAGEGEAGIAGDAEMAGSTASTATPGQVNTSGSGHEPERTSTQGRQTRQTAKRSGQIPVDIPDGHDDDIVARQLREAAEKETDPALKKKLWEEYKAYKKSSGI